MTTITRNLKRETPAAFYSQGRSRPIIVELRTDRPGLVGLRLKGRRRTYYLDVVAAYKTAVRNAIEQEKAERKKARSKNRN